MNTGNEKTKPQLEEDLIDNEKAQILQNDEDSEEYPIDINKVHSAEDNLENQEVSTSDKIPENKPPKKKCLFVELKDGISYFNLFSYYLTQFSYVCAFTFIDACQDYLLESKDYYNVDKENVGSINGDILLFDTLFLILFIYIYGSFHDIFGRKAMVVYGFISMAISLFFYPLAGNIYPNLILVRLIFSNGICAVTTQPLLADYVSHRTKGFGGGIAAVVSGLGAIFAATVLIKLQNYTDLLYVYWIAAGLSLGAALVCLFGVKNVQKNIVVERNVLKRL
jgi:MFS family permease